MSDLLEVEGLTAGYHGVPVLHGIDLRVPAGTICAVLGANGAGKTTLLRALSGLIRPSTGRIAFDGADLGDLATERLVRRGIGHVPEGRGVIAELTVEENLMLGGAWRLGWAGVWGAARAGLRRDVAEVYQLFPPLAARRRQPGHQLSGGERQMLALGRALVGRPRLLLLDEPSLGLAPRVVAQTMALLRQLCEQTRLTVLLVEQNVRSALSIADQGVVMSLGRVVAAGDARRLADDADLRHAYLGF
ncbi:MAG: ABC transporter ATP-binding protein [Micromonosporaceae bacterium]|nr:ABC transporter ATP-binding protein [Micromonosporaceae bacterium]